MLCEVIENNLMIYANKFIITSFFFLFTNFVHLTRPEKESEPEENKNNVKSLGGKDRWERETEREKATRLSRNVQE